MLHAIPWGKSKEMSLISRRFMLREDKETARQKAADVVENFRGLGLEKSASIVESDREESLQEHGVPSTHWRYIHTNNPLERLNQKIQRRTQVVGRFLDGQAALVDRGPPRLHGRPNMGPATI